MLFIRLPTYLILIYHFISKYRKFYPLINYNLALTSKYTDFLPSLTNKLLFLNLNEYRDISEFKFIKFD